MSVQGGCRTRQGTLNRLEEVQEPNGEEEVAESYDIGGPLSVCVRDCVV